MVKQRIESIDVLRGVIMVIMALDHVRDFFHIGAFSYNDPTNLETTTPILFFTRFITHYCAPTFIFLAGASAFLYGQGKSKKELSLFLFTRGLWMIFCELFIVKVLWSFETSYDSFFLQVIWAIGVCMILLSVLIHLPKIVLLLLGLFIISSHNLLDGITLKGEDFSSFLWYVVHQSNGVHLGNFSVYVGYPVLPWAGVMILGFCFGEIYSKGFDPILRKKLLLWIGLTAIGLFILIRGINLYGDMQPWSVQKDWIYSFLSFLNVSKYPPSLDYVLVTLGPSLLFLYFFEQTKNQITNFFLVFGKVPFFYYLMHLLFIHTFALLSFKLLAPVNMKEHDFGFSLGIVYLIWIGIVALLYPFCRMYMNDKARNKDKWWLSYL